MKKISIVALSALSLALLSGCSHKIASTPAVMVYDGSNVDYSQMETYKVSKICKALSASSGDTTITAAAKAGGISKIKHVDTSFEYNTFLFWQNGHKQCVTVYGE
ncbi:MAG: TRL domain-containing protein [Sulfurimonadaceae bacterium]|jgi:hypothetical protein|nr:TRL domain-containing protein [Sulfurimonadaceae bacterium]